MNLFPSRALSARTAFARLAVGAALVLAVASPSWSQVEHLHEPSALAADLALLRGAIEEAHPSVDRYASAAERESAFVTAAEQLDRPMTSVDFYRVVAPAVAAIRDGHTVLSLSDADRAAFNENMRLPPFRVHAAGGRLYVLRDLSETEGPRFAGREILAINGRRSSEILAQMSGMVPRDGSARTRPPFLLGQGLRFSFLSGVLFGSSAEYRLDLAGPGPRRVTLAGRTYAEIDRTWRARFAADIAPRLIATLEFLDGDAIGVLTVSGFERFMDAERSQSTSAFFNEAFASLKTRGSHGLIIDLRDNGGGADELGRELLAHIALKPFAYYRDLILRTRAFSFAAHSVPPGPLPDDFLRVDETGGLHQAEHPNLGEHRPAADAFTGRVYILMDGGSFSTTAEFLSMAHQQRRAVFIGEEGGGGYQGNTSGPAPLVTLPNTGLKLRLPLVRYEMAVDPILPMDRGVQPDHRVQVGVADILAGRDPVMDTALRLARTGGAS